MRSVDPARQCGACARDPDRICHHGAAEAAEHARSDIYSGRIRTCGRVIITENRRVLAFRERDGRIVLRQHGQTAVQIEQRAARSHRGRESGGDLRRRHRRVGLAGQDRARMETYWVGTFSERKLDLSRIRESVASVVFNFLQPSFTTP